MANSTSLKHQDDVVPLIINGKKIYTDTTYDVAGSNTMAPTHKASDANIAHGQDAIDAATKAFETWSLTTPAQRRDIMLAAAEILQKQAPVLMKAMKDEIGADDGWAEFNILLAKEALIDCAGRITAIEGRIPALNNPAAGGLIVKEPYGVVLAMAPWYVWLMAQILLN